MLAYLFPGQGSQICGMGKNLFDEFPEMVAQADAILGYSIKALCLEDPAKQLHQTQYTQPALYTVNALTYYKKLKETQRKPDIVAGHSLGEYNALLAAEVFDFATGLQLVKKRGALMSQVTSGGMAAVIGLTEYDITTMLQENNLTNIALANYNSYKQIVISGPKNDITRAQQVFKNSLIPLNVSGAFHSPYMLSAQQEFANFLDDIVFTIPTIPVLANLNAQYYHPKVMHFNLAQQITHAVQWVQSMEHLLLEKDIALVEIGPGSVLTKLATRIQNKQ